MRSSYRRFKELRENAQQKLKGRGVLEERLTNAVCEIDMMHEQEIPEYARENVKSIIDSCKTHKADGDEGIFRASINKKSYKELTSLKEAIEQL